MHKDDTEKKPISQILIDVIMRNGFCMFIFTVSNELEIT